MRRPAFWERDGWLPRMLAPLSGAWTLAVRSRRFLRAPARPAVPVICVGNVTAGGAGKTPVVMTLAARLAGRGRSVHVLSRGYRGRARGPLLVDPARDRARETGDEALLIARRAPVWVGADRAAAASRAVARGADVLVMDDGFQNPGLAGTLSILVVDGPSGLGNGRVMPAGPLREPLDDALARADAVVMIGADKGGLSRRMASRRRPILGAEVRPAANAPVLDGVPVHAFAGIALPGKFFATLEAMGAVVLRTRSFPDHHMYDPMTVTGMFEEAARAGARLVTTEKDWVRLDEATRPLAEAVAVELAFRDMAALDDLLDRALSRPAP